VAQGIGESLRIPGRDEHASPVGQQVGKLAHRARHQAASQGEGLQRREREAFGERRQRDHVRGRVDVARIGQVAEKANVEIARGLRQEIAERAVARDQQGRPETAGGLEQDAMALLRREAPDLRDHVGAGGHAEPLARGSPFGRRDPLQRRQPVGDEGDRRDADPAPEPPLQGA